MNRHLFIVLTLFLILILSSSNVAAARYALLVGVADYPHVPKLLGPVHDVTSLKELLVGRYDVPASNITTLVNSKATKKNILQALADLKNMTHKGDFIFFYFSGHGTSAYDREVSPSMDNSTGAIVPYDFNAVPGNAQKTLERLIIGRRDLQPLLLELDRNRSLFVIFDSCYSGNAVRAIRTGRGIPKFVPLDIPMDTAAFSAIKELPFPYTSLVYFAASHQTETADDLRPEDTHDGRAHGALTDSLLLGLRGDADLNHDGNITYEELYDYSRQKMQTVARQTPQAKSNRSMSSSVLEHNNADVSASMLEANSVAARTRISVTGTSAARLKKALAGLHGVTLVSERFDLRLVSSGRQITAYLPSGDTLCSVNSIEEACERVKRFVSSRGLLTLKNHTQSFNLFIRPLEDQGKSVFFRGEHLGVQVTSEADAYLMLLNIDSHGYVTPLLPNASDDNWIRANVPLTLAEIGTIEPPLGVEYLKLFAFSSPIKDFNHFIGKTLSPAGSEFNQLLSIIKSQQGWSSTTMEVVTMEKK